LLLAFLFIGACDRGDRQKANEEAEQAREKARELGKKAENEAKDVRRRVDDSVATATSSSAAQGAAQKLDNAALLAKIKAKLASEVGLNTVTGVEVDASSHVVTLSGNVSSTDQKHQAARVVAKIAGVTKVINNLEVRQ
jgi:hyperosmotically inducible protein